MRRSTYHLHKTTEFFLYYAHLVSNGQPYPYADTSPPVTTLYTKWPQEHETVMRLIREARSPYRPVFGLHRLRLPQLNQEQASAITSLWKMELLEDHESAEWFLSSDAS